MKKEIIALLLGLSVGMAGGIFFLATEPEFCRVHVEEGSFLAPVVAEGDVWCEVVK